MTLRVKGLTPITALSLPPLVPFGTGGLYVPERFGAEVDDSSCAVLVEVHVEMIDGRPECVDLRAKQRPGGPPVTGEALRRIRVQTYVQLATAIYTHGVERRGDVEFGYATGSEDGPRIARAFEEIHPRRARVVDDELLSEVVDVYRESEGSAVAVGRHFAVSRATAYRWIAEARTRGLLESDESDSARKGKPR